MARPLRNRKPQRDSSELEEVIRQVKGKWFLYTRDGKKKLGGPYDTRAQAVKRERQVQFFKHQGEIMSKLDLHLDPELLSEERKHHSAAWHRCWEKVKGKYDDSTAAAICTWSLKRAPNPPDVYESGIREQKVTINVDDDGLDTELHDIMIKKGIKSLKIDTDTWDVEETPMKKGMKGEKSKELAEMGDMEMQKLAYVPGGITSFADLQAAEDVYEATEEMNQRVQQFQQLAWNIFYSPEITDKIGSLRGLVDEFAALMGDATASVTGAELSEAATIKAKAKAAINALSALLADKTIPKELGEKIEGVRSALRQNWKDLETLANDESEESVGEKLCETWSGPITISEAEPAADSLLTMNVGLIRAGWGNNKDNHYYSAQTLQDSASKFVGAKMFETDHRPGEKSTRTWVSTVREIVGMADDGTLVAKVVAHDPNFAERVRNLSKAGLLEKMECSILAEGKAGPRFSENGRSGKSILEITGVESVDWVTRAGAGGRALSLAESDGAQNAPEMNGEQIMEEKPKVETTPPIETTHAPAAETVPVTITETQPPETITVSGAPPPAPEASPAQTLEAAVVCETMAASSLPKTAQERLGKANYSTMDELNAAILAEREYIKIILGAGRPHDSGPSQPVAPKKVDLSERFADIDRRYGLGG